MQSNPNTFIITNLIIYQRKTYAWKKISTKNFTSGKKKLTAKKGFDDVKFSTIIGWMIEDNRLNWDEPTQLILLVANMDFGLFLNHGGYLLVPHPRGTRSNS